MRILIVLALSLVAAMPVLAKEQAGFIKGTYATAKGCKMLQKLKDGTPRGLKTVPETLDKDGLHGWEGSCEFTKVFEHVPGKVWTGLMYCVQENTINVPNMVFILDEETGSFEVLQAGAENPEIFQPCTTK